MKSVWRVFALIVLLLPLLTLSSYAAEKKAAAKEVKKEMKDAVVLMPLRPTKDIPQDEMTQYEAALVKSLSEKYVVYSGQKVLEKVNDVYKKRSAEAKAGKECDETKCLQDVALAFQTKEGYPFVAIANIRKTGGGYSISLTINDVIEEKSVFAEQKPCEGCNEFKVMGLLQTLAGGGAAQPAVEAAATQAAKGAGGNDAEIAFWNSIKDSTNAADFAAYLESYPKGTFAPLAKRRMEKTPAQIAAEKAAADKVAAEKATAEEETKHPGMVFVKQGDGGFYMDKTEVTQEAYERVIGSNPSNFKGCPTCPVELVNWDEAVAYCQNVGKRLPTEKEWEYAASEGGKNVYAGTSNESELGDYAWYDKNSGNKTYPVGGKKPNGLGLYDMSGNVWEWTDSWYDDSKKYRVLRGGSWFASAFYLRAALRFNYDPVIRYNYIGFRCSQY
ncbi:MAG: SUMF1/EgtB/PvdO family nonheme iron enzyme [Nitrospinae bacterium]|nr:SUMF1/EgtB/PvdO family nonheme iron enzyme [Nitrospinota bacterium]